MSEQILIKSSLNLNELLKIPSNRSIVVAIIAHSGMEIFSSDRKALHDFFREMKENPRYAKLLEGFVFSKVDIYPFSRDLEDVLNGLCLAGDVAILTRERFAITDASRKRILAKTAKMYFSDNERLLLQELGDHFAAKIKIG